MRIVCMTNEGQLSMMKNMLNSAMKNGFDMNLFHCYILETDKDCQAYNTFGFKWLTVKKLEVILKNMELDSEVLWVDNDIVFFENCIENIKRYNGDFVMQDDIWSPCTGFFLIRSNDLSKKIIQMCIDRIHELKDVANVDDQNSFLHIYKTIENLNVVLLPLKEYPNGHIYFEKKETENSKIVHCNFLRTTIEKLERLKNYNLWNESDIAFNIVNKYYFGGNTSL